MRKMNTYRADIVCFLLMLFFSVGYFTGKYDKELTNFLIEKVLK
jgi:hypothetical protein